MKYILVFIIQMAIVAVCQGAANSASEFVSVKGNQFSLNDKPYVFVGTNLWYGAYLGAGSKAGDRARLLQELELLKKHGVTNLRVLASSENSDLERSVTPSMQIEPGELNESLLVGLDYLLSEMAKRDMKAVLYLNNFWQWSGGMTQYVEWADGVSVSDPDKTGDWDQYISGAASFYRSKKANKLFKNYIAKIVNRKNTVSEVLYSEDPTIMSWELANEPRAGVNNLPKASKQPFIDWVANTARYIKSLDSNHLVTTGSEGSAGTSQDEDLYVKAHSSKHIDYMTVHLWPKNWSWLDMTKPEETYPIAIDKAVSYVNKHIAFAERLNKPIVLEEFGIERDHANYAIEGSTQYRDAFYQSMFRLIESNVEVCGPMVGSNFWGWGGLGRASDKDLVWKSGDDFTGDPPQEPQGLNSVFDVDVSTLRVLSEHNTNLERISKLNSEHCNTK